jgi:hypothetical protein
MGVGVGVALGVVNRDDVRRLELGPSCPEEEENVAFVDS